MAWWAVDRAARLGVPWVRRHCQVARHRTRRHDPANWASSFKADADGLVDAGVLHDDDASRMIGPDLRLGPPGPDAVLAEMRWGRVVLYVRARPDAADLA